MYNDIILDKILKNSDELIEVLSQSDNIIIIPDLSVLKQSITEDQSEIKQTILRINMFKVANQSYELANDSQNSIILKAAGKTDLINSVNNVNNTVISIKTLNSMYKNPSNKNITPGITNIMYSNYVLVNEATFSVISIQDAPNMSDYLLINYNNHSDNKNVKIILGLGTQIIFNTAGNTKKINIYSPQTTQQESNSTFMVSKSDLDSLINTDMVTPITITSYTTFFNQLLDLESALANNSLSIKSQTENIYDSFGSSINRILSIILYITCILFLLYLLFITITNNRIINTAHDILQKSSSSSSSSSSSFSSFGKQKKSKLKSKSKKQNNNNDV